MKGVRLVTLDIQHTQHTVFNFEREDHLRTGLWQAVNETKARISFDIVHDDPFPLRRSLSDQPLTDLHVQGNGPTGGRIFVGLAFALAWSRSAGTEPQSTGTLLKCE